MSNKADNDNILTVSQSNYLKLISTAFFNFLQTVMLFKYEIVWNCLVVIAEV